MHDQTRWTYFFCEFMEMALYYPRQVTTLPAEIK